MTQLITPCIWFDGQAAQAAALYTSLFQKLDIKDAPQNGKVGQDFLDQPDVMMAEFELAGMRMMGLNGGPQFKSNPSISFFVQLQTPAQVDRLWASLSDGGEILMPLDNYGFSPRYGWLNDRFGVSWQISQGPLSDVRRHVSPLLSFVGKNAGKAEEALNLYTSIFPNSTIDGIARHDGKGVDAAGTVMHAQFYLNGETFMVIDSAAEHAFAFNEGVSLSVTCETQDEVNHYWNALIADGGSEGNCGWLKDPFGVSWQIVPTALGRLMSSPDRKAAGRTLQAMLNMKKLDIAGLEAAHAVP